MRGQVTIAGVATSGPPWGPRSTSTYVKESSGGKMSACDGCLRVRARFAVPPQLFPPEEEVMRMGTSAHTAEPPFLRMRDASYLYSLFPSPKQVYVPPPQLADAEATARQEGSFLLEPECNNIFEDLNETKNSDTNWQEHGAYF